MNSVRRDMRTLHLYLIRQILATLVMTVLVFTFVLLLGNVLKEILSLLLGGQASLLVILKALGLLVPFVLVFSLPMGLLTATLLVFGRFSADQELTAARASGISLFSLVVPILLLSVGLSGFCAWVNLELAPQARTAYKVLLDSVVKRALQNPARLLQENQFVQTPGGYTIYVRKIDGENLRDVEIYQANEKEKATRWLKAPTGRFHYDPSSRKIKLTLFKAYGAQKEGDHIQPLPDQGEISLEMDPTVDPQKKIKPKLKEMTFTQLRAEIRDMEAQAVSSLPAQVQLHRMLSFSFACVGFTLIGIPLGIQAHRRETSIGMAIALALALVYYGFILLGQSFDTQPEMMPQLILWVPNFLFQIIGGILLWRANHGG